MDKKQKQLGIPFGTACSQLRKSIIFELVKETKRDICFHCGMVISSLTELSIEHKEPWSDSNKPRELFFSWQNISFSHLSCNSAAARKPTKYATEEERIAVRRCQRAKWMREHYSYPRRKKKYVNTGY